MRLNVAYVTGSHALKLGMQMIYGYHERPTWVLNDMYYQFLNTAPRSLTEWATPYNTIDKLRASPSFFAQDQWTKNRLTATFGLRVDTLHAYVPAISLPATGFAQLRRGRRPPEWTDFSPRTGMAYDLFGNGRRRSRAASIATFRVRPWRWRANNPVVTSILSYPDLSDTNKNFVPDCDFSI
jgi:hypothetical protein